MTRRILLSLLMIGLTVAGVSSATAAYFSSTVVQDNNTFSMGSVKIGNLSGMPLTFTNLIPTIQQTKDVALQYTGTTPADIYIGFSDQGGGSPSLYDSAHDISYMEAAIYDKDTDKWVIGWTDVGHFFADWTKIATSVSGGWKHYTVYVRLKSTAANEFQGVTNTNHLVIHAIQSGVSITSFPKPHTITAWP